MADKSQKHESDKWVQPPMSISTLEDSFQMPTKPEDYGPGLMHLIYPDHWEAFDTHIKQWGTNHEGMIETVYNFVDDMLDEYMHVHGEIAFGPRTVEWLLRFGHDLKLHNFQFEAKYCTQCRADLDHKE